MTDYLPIKITPDFLKHQNELAVTANLPNTKMIMSLDKLSYDIIGFSSRESWFGKQAPVAHIYATENCGYMNSRYTAVISFYVPGVSRNLRLTPIMNGKIQTEYLCGHSYDIEEDDRPYFVMYNLCGKESNKRDMTAFTISVEHLRRRARVVEFANYVGPCFVHTFIIPLPPVEIFTNHGIPHFSISTRFNVFTELSTEYKKIVDASNKSKLPRLDSDSMSILQLVEKSLERAKV